MTVSVSNDLRNKFGPVRDQGRRPTCLAFAASDAHAALRGAWRPLSCEYIFFHAQRRGNRLPSVGATLSDMLNALRHDGQPEESGWSYLLPPIDPVTWRPPAKVATLFHRASDRKSKKTDEIIVQLGQGRPVVVLMTISNAFYQANTKDVVNTAEPVNSARRHAVIAIANGTHDSDRVILVRNSWGKRWGDSGHAWLSESYLEPRIFDLAILKENIDVSSRSTAA